MTSVNSGTTLMTVVSETDGILIERSFTQLVKLCNPDEIAAQLIWINTPDPAFVARIRELASHLPWATLLFESGQNVCDLPAYNAMAWSSVKTPEFIIYSPDTRVLNAGWITAFLTSHRETGAVISGAPGPGWNLGEDSVSDQNWGWVPALLVARNLHFENCEHVQTWCCVISTSAFNAIGGFWEAPAGQKIGKGDLITGEIYLSVSLKKAGGRLNFSIPPMHHYGTAWATLPDGLARYNQFDSDHHWAPV